MKKLIDNTDLNLKNHDFAIKKLKEKVSQLAYMISASKKEVTLTNLTSLVKQECAMKLEPSRNSYSKSSNLHRKGKKNELPPKEKDPRSFILPFTIGNTTVNNALADLGASIIVMPYFMFKHLGLGTHTPINMVIEMADRFMQSPKGIVENVLRPMLATTHARIDVFGKRSL
nr:hypothetical protein [Tanacetum cinerariifolium]